MNACLLYIEETFQSVMISDEMLDWYTLYNVWMPNNHC